MPRIHWRRKAASYRQEMRLPLDPALPGRTSAIIMSRQGRSSIEPRLWASIDRVADLRAVQLETRPGCREAVALLDDVDVVASTNLCLPVLDAHLLDALPRLRAIVLYATGYDHIDVALLRERGIGLSVLHGYATAAVAEQGLAMLLALATRLHLAHDRSRGVAPERASLRGVELEGKTVGVVGVGRIGSRLAEMCRGLRMRVVGTDIDRGAEAAARTSGVEMGSIDWLLGRSDAVVVCASHSFSSPPIIGREELAAMRDGALLVNVARSALVDTAAATAAVRCGQLRGYAVDDAVLDPCADGDLLAEGRVLQTGHSAWWRDEVLERGARMWGEHLLAAIHGTPLDAVTWPQVSRTAAGSLT